MRHSLPGCVVVAAVLTLGLVGRTAAQSPGPSVSVTIQADGRVAISPAGRGAPTLMTLEEVAKGIACPLVRPAVPGDRAVIRVEPNADYGAFMAVANRLQDCGVYAVRIITEYVPGEGRSAAARGVDLSMTGAEPPPPLPLCSRPASPNEEPICPPAAPPKAPEFVSLADDGSVYASTNTKTAKKKTLDALAIDLPVLLNSAAPTHERIFVRADAHVKCGRFTALLNQLRRDGYDHLALINEELRY